MYCNSLRSQNKTEVLKENYKNVEHDYSTSSDSYLRK